MDERVEKANRKTGWEFLERLLEAVANCIRTLPTDTGIQFAAHRLTKPPLPWANGQVKPMTRTIKDATVKRDHDNSHDLLCSHPAGFTDADTSARRLTPHGDICKIWTSGPDCFIVDPVHQLPGLSR